MTSTTGQLTPLQRIIVRRNQQQRQCRNRQWRYYHILMVISFSALFCCILFYIYQQTHYSIASMNSSQRREQQRQYHIFEWDVGELEEDDYDMHESDNINSPSHSTQLSSSSSRYRTSQLNIMTYDPWNIFTIPKSSRDAITPSTTKTSTTSKTNPNTPSIQGINIPVKATTATTTLSSAQQYHQKEQHLSQQQQQQPSQLFNDDNNNNDDDDGSGNDDDNDDDNTLLVKQRKQKQKSTTAIVHSAATSTASKKNSKQSSHQQQSQTTKENAHDDEKVDDNDSSNYINSNMKNPKLYGWIPDQYPNPIIDPVKCAISYILPHLSTLSSTDIVERNDGNDFVQSFVPQPPPPQQTSLSSLNTTMIQNNIDHNQENRAMRLRLCDPDWVLGGVYLEDVAIAMMNFSTIFSRDHHTPMTDNNNNNNNENQQEPIVGDGSSQTSSVTKATLTPLALLNQNNTAAATMTSTTSNNEGDHWDVEVVGPSGNRRLRRALRKQEAHQEPESLIRIPFTANNSRRRTMMSIMSRLGNQNGNSNNNNINNQNRNNLPKIELAVATVRKMDIAMVLHQSNDNNNNNYNAMGELTTNSNDQDDDDDMVNDAAQIFARTIHDNWWSSSSLSTVDSPNDDDAFNSTNTNFGYDLNEFMKFDNNNDPADYGILLFLSVQDRVCFISTGSHISNILPWWRLDHIVTNMKPKLQNREYGIAILHAIHDISDMLLTGPPTIADRIHDFITRFGIVIAFAIFTFCFGAWGEYRDRRKRWQYAEERSKLTSVERQKAQQLQVGFRTRCCPICLERYDYGDSTINDTVDEYDVVVASVAASPDTSKVLSASTTEKSIPNSNSLSNLLGDLGDPWKGAVDEYGIPRRGADGRKIKLLRCGHLFCETCWRSWVHSVACGSPCSCPVCRQDVGKALSRSRRTRSAPGISNIIPEEVDGNAHDGNERNEGTSNTSMLRSATSYNSFADQRTNRPNTSNTARIVRVNTMLRGAILFRQTSAFANRSTEYVEQHTQPQPQLSPNETTSLLHSI